jgi:hypothetical protein
MYPAFRPQDLYQTRLQQFHKNYQEEFKSVKRPKEAALLRLQLFQQLQDTETSFKMIQKNIKMLSMTPEELQETLSIPSTAPKPDKKGFLLKMSTPKVNPDRPRTRSQDPKRQDDKTQTK